MNKPTKKLSRLERVPLREVWDREDTNFTPWLAEDENLQLLGDALKMNIESAQCEYKVGRFSLDILAKDGNTNTDIIIENQYGKTDHIHLGQLITYASGCDAKTVVWLTEVVLDEHKSAMEWLNENSNEGVSFFLVKVEAYRIDNSLPAPRFEVVVSPNNWVRNIQRKISNVKGLSPLRQKQLEFWQGFAEHMGKVKDFKPSTAMADNYYLLGTGFSLGSKLSLKIQEKESCLTCLVYLPKNLLGLFDFLSKSDKKINKELGKDTKWIRTEQAGKIEKNFSVDDIYDENKYQQYYKWLSDQAVVFKKVLPKYVAQYKEDPDTDWTS